MTKCRAESCHGVVVGWPGSGVTRRALEAVKDVWEWSEMRKAGPEVGMFPFERLADRRFMDHHGKRYKAATKMEVRREEGRQAGALEGHAYSTL